MNDLAHHIQRMEQQQADSLTVAFRSHQPMAPPNPPERTCPTCLLRVTVGPDWHCPACETKLIYSLTRMTCECGRTRAAQYVGNRIRPLGKCYCEKSKQQQKADQDAARKAELEAKQLAQQVQDAGEAQQCWVITNERSCQLPSPGPHPYCYACERFSGHYQSKRRAWEREQRAARISPGTEFEEIPL